MSKSRKRKRGDSSEEEGLLEDNDECMFIRASDLHEFMSDDKDSEEIVSKSRGRPKV